MQFRVVPGSKAPGDLRLEWSAPGGWEPVPMAAAALVSDFMVANEAHLMTTPAGAHRRIPADEYWFGYLRHAVVRGWDQADAQLQAQRPPAQPRLCPACHAHHPAGTVCP